MTPTLSPQQREEVLEAAGMAKALKHYARCFDKPEDDPHVVMNAKANWRALWLEEDTAALDAALPAIIGAVLERAAQCAERHEFRAEYTPNAIAADIRALAEEAR